MVNEKKNKQHKQICGKLLGYILFWMAEHAGGNGKVLRRYEKTERFKINDGRMYENVQVVSINSGSVRNNFFAVRLLS